MEQPDFRRFRILVCIDGSEESYRGLRYAARLERGLRADIVMLNVRLLDRGLRSGGMQVRVARQNILEWGLELASVRYLHKGREILIELGELQTDWPVRETHRDVQGDPLGDYCITHTNPRGRRIELKLKTAADIAGGILEECREGDYDLVIVGAIVRKRGLFRCLGTGPVTQKVALHAPCSVLAARRLEPSHGHLITTDGSDRAMAAIEQDAVLAGRCDCSISLISVAPTEAETKEAEAHLATGKDLLNARGIEVEQSFLRVGDPVQEIIQVGRAYSVIVVAESKKTGLQRFLSGGTAAAVLEQAETSVLVMR